MYTEKGGFSCHDLPFPATSVRHDRRDVDLDVETEGGRAREFSPESAQPCGHRRRLGVVRRRSRGGGRDPERGTTGVRRLVKGAAKRQTPRAGTLGAWC
jgi:hypothetical protein